MSPLSYCSSLHIADIIYDLTKIKFIQQVDIFEEERTVKDEEITGHEVTRKLYQTQRCKHHPTG